MGKRHAGGCSIVAAVVVGFVALALPSGAGAATFTEVMPFSDVVENPCNGRRL